MKTLSFLLALLLFPTSAVLAHGPAAPDPVSLEEGLAAFGWNFDEAEVKTEKLEEGFYVLYGLGGNVAVSSGEDGVLIVDDQFPEMVPGLLKAMRKQGDKRVDFVINTHWHFDHADGNKMLGAEKNTWLVSQANSRRMMRKDNVVNLVGVAIEQPAYPALALPDITFDETMQFHLNGERIDLLHSGPAHTTGDAAVIFRGRNAVHMGDVFNNAGYPFIDADNGGSLDGVIEFCKSVLREIREDTVVIPGHGPLASRRELHDYVRMLETVRGDLVAMIRAGKSREDILAAGITATWDERWGDPARFIDRSHASLTRRYLQ